MNAGQCKMPFISHRGRRGRGDNAPMRLTHLSDIARLTGGDGAIGAGGVDPLCFVDICASEICAGEVRAG